MKIYTEFIYDKTELYVSEKTKLIHENIELICKNTE